MRSNYKQLGKYIREVDIRNTVGNTDNLLGVSVLKHFMPSIANTVGTDFSTYKVVKRNQFTYIPDTSRRGEKIGIALLHNIPEGLVSQAYTVFEITNHNQLDPEYLMMWFRRPEFDRYARFKSHGSVREIFDWEEICKVELPVPHINKQRELVKEYNTIVNRINLNNQLIQKLVETAQAIYKQWFVDFEFPDENGQPYKSSGGKMVWCEELGMEIPVGWRTNKLIKLCNIKGGKRLPKGDELNNLKSGNPYIKVADMNNCKFICYNNDFQHVDFETQKKISRYVVSSGDLILSIVGSIGILNIIDQTLNNANLTENCVRLTKFNEVTADYLYHFFISKRGLQEIETRTVGGVQGKLPLYNIQTIIILCPADLKITDFQKTINKFNSILKNKTKQNINLAGFKELLLSKISSI